MRDRGKKEREILLTDEMGVDHRVKYLDEDRVVVDTITRFVSEYGTEDTVHVTNPARIRLKDLSRWPLTKGLQRQILVWHAQFPFAK
jgi:hypothetical protein